MSAGKQRPESTSDQNKWTLDEEFLASLEKPKKTSEGPDFFSKEQVEKAHRRAVNISERLEKALKKGKEEYWRELERIDQEWQQAQDDEKSDLKP